MSKVSSIGKIGALVGLIDNYKDNVITCKSCGKSKEINKFKRSGDYYKCECTAIIDRVGRVIDYGERDVYRVAQNVKIEIVDRALTKYVTRCSFCGKDTYITTGSKWFTCEHCKQYQSIEILCSCGGTFIATKNTWAYRCVHCKRIVDSDGNYLNKHRYIICGCCGEPILKEICSITVGFNNNIYKCSNCYTYNNSNGKQLFHEDLCTCKECNTLFEREKYRYRGRGSRVPLGTLYKCPGCDSLLDFTGNCTQAGVMDKCNNCNLTFSRILNANHPWLIQCPSCNEYVDNCGDILAPNDIGECKRCLTRQPKYVLKEGCSLCGYTELVNGELICEGCNTLFDNEDLLGRACIFCGAKIVKNE